MATKPKATAQTVDPDKQYQVDLTAPIAIGPHLIQPGPNVVLSGAAILAAPAGIVSGATEIDA